MSVAELVRTRAWAAGLRFLHAGYYWEAHEVLEPVWMQTARGSPEREVVQAVIQVANAALKVRMDRPRAVQRLCDIAEEHLGRATDGPPVMGLSRAEVAGWIAELREGRFVKSAL